MCHFNSTVSIQSCSHFGELNLSYTLPSLSYKVLIFTWVKWSIWGWSTSSKDTTLKQRPEIERGRTWYCAKDLIRISISWVSAGSLVWWLTLPSVTRGLAGLSPALEFKLPRNRLFPFHLKHTDDIAESAAFTYIYTCLSVLLAIYFRFTDNEHIYNYAD